MKQTALTGMAVLAVLGLLGMGGPGGAQGAPVGTLEGTVVDATTGSPIAGASVQAGPQLATTDGYGAYRLTGLSPAAYTVTASALWYVSQTAQGVAVSDGAVTTQDFTLAPLTVRGVVTDGSGQGWPLYGRIDIEGSGYRDTLYTDPATGYYQVNLPAGLPFTFRVSAVGGGYTAQTRSVTPEAWGSVESFLLAVDAATCLAPGYGGGGCAPLAGGLVVGTVRDAQTGRSLPGASISLDGPGAAVTGPEGRYILFASPGAHDLSASKENCGTVTRSVTVISGVMKEDFPLPTGLLAVSPSNLTVTVDLGGSETRSISLSNTGTLPVLFEGSAELTPVTTTGLALDDGTAETAIGVDGGGGFLWLNRFTPPQDFPLILDRVSVVFPVSVNAGDAMEVVVWEDADGDGDPSTGAVFRGSEYVAVKFNDGATWNDYPLSRPIRFDGPGDILVGVVNRSGVTGYLDFPAALDTTSSQSRSYIGTYTGTPGHPPVLPAPGFFGTINSFPPSPTSGNWMIRAEGYYPGPVEMLLDEGFETTAFPPTGWGVQVLNAARPWFHGLTSHTGTHSAQVFYSSLAPQDEWLLSPVLDNLTGGTLSLWSLGSIDRCRAPLDNCDLNVWLIVGDPGGGDDVFVGRLEDSWTGEYVWSPATFNLTPLLPGGPVRIGIEYMGLEGADAAVDDIRLTGITPGVAWLDLSPAGGILAGGADETVTVIFNASGLPNGSYTARLLLAGDTPYAPVVVPVTMNVGIYSISASVSGGHGGISPASQWVTLGGSAAIDLSPDTNYHVASLTDNGIPVAGPYGNTYTLSDVTVDHVVAVTFAIDTYAIDASVPGGHGTVDPPSQMASYGATAAVGITPDRGYRIASITDNGSSATIANPYVIAGVGEAHTVEVTFDPDSYTVNASVPGGHGGVDPASQAVSHGSSATLHFVPEAGYQVASVTDNGVAVGTANPYVIAHVTEPHTVAVSFALKSYTITASAPAGHGGVAPASQTVDHGATAAITLAPDSNYAVVSIVDNGVLIAGPYGGTYTLSNVQAGHGVVVTFGLQTFTVSASVTGGHGAVTPASQTVIYGTGAAIHITPDPGYRIASITDNGSPAAVSNPFVVANVTAAHAVVVTFGPDTFSVSGSVTDGHGTVSPPSQSVNSGSSATLVFTPDDGYQVGSVVDNGVAVGAINPYIIPSVTEPHTVTVTYAIRTYAITAVAGPNGSILPASPVSVAHGGNRTFTITPDSGYRVFDVLVDGVSVSPVTSYTFSNVTSGHTLHAFFAFSPRTIMATAGPYGQISPAGSVAVNYGEQATFFITPNVGYHVADVRIDSESVGPVLSYTFSNVMTDRTIAATFAVNTYTISAASGSNGTVTPAGAIPVNYGASLTVTITPDVGYRVTDVLVDGASVGAVTSYPFTGVTTGHSIYAVFAPFFRTITAAAGANGTITPAGTVSIPTGSDATFAITPSTGYHVSNVTVDGIQMGAISSYTFAAVTTDHSIAASFVVNSYAISSSAGPHGRVLPSGTTSVIHGGSRSLTIVPDTGAHIVDVLVDGVSVGPVTSYTFDPVTGPHTISALFEVNVYRITASAGAHGNVAPGAEINVSHGEAVSVLMIPETGYHVDRVEVDSTLVGTVSAYTFSGVTSDHTLSVTFAPNAYTLTSLSGVNGTITASKIVNHGDSSTFLITPDSGFHVAYLLVDGTFLAPANTHSFSNVSSDHWIYAVFAVNIYTLSVNVDGAGSGRVTSTPAGIDCRSDCSTTYERGTQVRLTAVADPGSLFTGWSGACGGTGDCVLQMNGDAEAVATFANLPKLFVLPSGSHDFGKALVGGEVSYDLTLGNTGTADLHISTLALLDSVTYTVEPNSCPGLLMTLPPASSCTVTVTFNPASAGTKPTTLRIYSDDPDAPTFSVPLTGKGVAFAVDPAEGGKGTLLTIEGSGFGVKKGKVLLGSKALKVLVWTDVQIRAQITKVFLPGSYDVTVTPKLQAPIVERGAFTVK